MNMEMVGWIVLGWFVVALVVSIVLGGFLSQSKATREEVDFATAAAKSKVMRFMRIPAARSVAVRNIQSAPRPTRQQVRRQVDGLTP